jgi:predicted ribosome quality control (RQC) complex YloA/Tae2 family protein
MHFHHYTLRHLCHHFNQTHQGESVINCFSQSRNELIIAFSSGYLRIGCNTPDTYVVPVPDFAKARKNVVDLFAATYGLTIGHCRVVDQEREMIIALSDGYEFILKLHGNMANVLLRHGGEIVDLFDHRHEADWEYQEQPGTANLSALDQGEAEGEQSLRKIQQVLRQVSPIYDKLFAQRIATHQADGLSLPGAFDRTVAEAESGQFWIVKEAQRMRLLLFPPPGDELPSQQVDGVVEALIFWLKTQFQYRHYREQYKFIWQALAQPFEKLQKIYDGYVDNVAQLEAQRDPEEIGHLIMANLHAIPPDTDKVELEDLYLEGMVEVKLEPKLSPQANAKRYYDRHKQRRDRLLYLKEQVEDLETRLIAAEEELAQFHALVPPEALAFDDRGFDLAAIKALKEMSKAAWKEQKAAEEERFPFRSFQREGYQIFVGRNARNNDELSFKFAHKNDLWLHAKDVTGSHVIIRQRPGKDLPPSVLAYAAQLAAYYSKRKNDTLVPVAYTPRKYIRKRKGDPPGLVAVDREAVIMVEPMRG